tara:strand:+ start:275 stop:478 length:204 start_codon:yes stop_codon:yes gene_type:complete
MNFIQTQKLVRAMSDIESWSQSYIREMDKSPEFCDYDKLTRFQKWIDDAKTEVFNLANELSSNKESN